jgi:uncharacterized membrane protein (UPF0127 family)
MKRFSPRWLLLGALVMVACPHQNNEGKRGTPSAKRGTVVLKAGSRTVRVEVEVVRTPELRAKGLKHRKSLGAYKGMLFIFDREEIQSFWMQDTYIPLDMIFINQKLEVVGVVENAEPLTTTSRRVPAKSTFVLEVNGGFAKRHGIARGTTVELEGI